MKEDKNISPTLVFEGIEEKNVPRLFRDYADQRFLVGYCRKEKKAWIQKNKIYPARIRKGSSPGVNPQSKDYKNVDFLILHNGGKQSAYVIYPVLEIKTYSKDEIAKLEYPSPNHDYLCYSFGEPVEFEKLEIQKLLQQLIGPYYIPKSFAGKTIYNRFIYSIKNEQRNNLIQQLINSIDILEDNIFSLDEQGLILETILRDQTMDSSSNGKKHRHIIWATDNYRKRGEGYNITDEISIVAITKHKGRVIRPRAFKSKEEQLHRVKQKAEVFTPSWVCNAQNNQVDEAWFGCKDVFNHENEDHTWTHTTKPITFPKGKTWMDYVMDRRIEICCGEAPYLVSRYDTTTGVFIEDLDHRVGLLDRKLRVVNENAKNVEDWKQWAQRAIRNIYGFEWQGDSLLIARENILITYIEYFCAFCKKHNIAIELNTQSLQCVAEWISWNIWQMDGIKYIVPYSDSRQEKTLEMNFFEEEPKASAVGIKAQITLWSSSGRQRGSRKITFEELVNKK